MNIWVYSDPHFGHAKLVMSSPDKPPARPTFLSVQEMNETLVARHNELVKPNDIVWCLGDFAINPRFVEEFAPRLNGKKGLILGNHDTAHPKFYLNWFDKLLVAHELDGMLFTHYPVAPWSQRYRANIHGHCHLTRPLHYTAADPTQEGFVKGARYVNLCVEHTGYRPVSLEQISQWVRS